MATGRILVVHASGATRAMLTELLSADGLRVEAVGSTIAAISRFVDEPAALVMLGLGQLDAVELERIGAGEGFIGEIGRLRLRYSVDASSGDAPLPSTLIAKFPTPEHENRVMGELMGVYWREIHFYDELSEEMPIRVPHHYYSALTPDPMRARQDQIVKLIDSAR